MKGVEVSTPFNYFLLSFLWGIIFTPAWPGWGVYCKAKSDIASNKISAFSGFFQYLELSLSKDSPHKVEGINSLNLAKVILHKDSSANLKNCS